MRVFLFIFFSAMISPVLFAQDSDTLFLFYEVDSDRLIATEQQKLDEFITSNIDNIESIQLNTFCDTTASVSYNKELSSRRLTNLSIAFGSIPITSSNTFGEVSGKTTNYNSAYSRRAEVIYSLNKKENNPASSSSKTFRKTGNPFVDFIGDSTVKTTTIRLSILFYTNSDIYYAKFENELLDLYKFMRDNPNVRAHIRGHVCCGDDYTLSSNRAFKIYKYLKTKSIDVSRMSFKGYSNSIPEVSPEVTEYDKLRNRRVDIIFTKENN